ncbi:hypothetical protein V8F06_006088 [Rhypophila decipiens]
MVSSLSSADPSVFYHRHLSHRQSTPEVLFHTATLPLPVLHPLSTVRKASARPLPSTGITLDPLNHIRHLACNMAAPSPPTDTQTLIDYQQSVPPPDSGLSLVVLSFLFRGHSCRWPFTTTQHSSLRFSVLSRHPTILISTFDCHPREQSPALSTVHAHLSIIIRSFILGCRARHLRHTWTTVLTAMNHHIKTKSATYQSIHTN